MNRHDHQKSNKTLEERVPYFMDHVMFEPNSGCWLWTGSVNLDGYGNFFHNKKCFKAHRFSHMAFIGPIPDGMDVMHKCDTPGCVNPSHIKAATTLENVQDCWAKGRKSGHRGEKNGRAKLSSEQVSEIRSKAKSGENKAIIARRLGVSWCTVNRIVKGEAWI